MIWRGHPENDRILSLLDETQTAILGQLVRDELGEGWRAHDYIADNGAGKQLGVVFPSLIEARAAVITSVETSLRGMKGSVLQ